MQKMLCHFYNTHKAVTRLIKQNLQIYRVYFISSMYSVPHFGHAKVSETSVWATCFQILAMTQSMKNITFL